MYIYIYTTLSSRWFPFDFPLAFPFESLSFPTIPKAHKGHGESGDVLNPLNPNLWVVRVVHTAKRKQGRFHIPGASGVQGLGFPVGLFWESLYQTDDVALGGI